MQMREVNNMPQIKCNIINIQDTKDGKIKVTVHYSIKDHPSAGQDLYYYNHIHTVNAEQALTPAEIKAAAIAEIQAMAQTSYTKWKAVYETLDFESELGKTITVDVT